MWDLRKHGKENFVVDERQVIIASVPEKLKVQWQDIVNQVNQLLDKADILEQQSRQQELQV